jgi:hypothetical protein
MRRFIAQIEGITFSPSGMEVARIRHGDDLTLQPGQVILSYKPGSSQPLRKALYPIHIYQEGFIADSPPEPDWRIGDMLLSYGPLGDGFSPPASAKKWLLTSFDAHPEKLLALIQPGLDHGAAIALCSEELPANLAPQVEWISDLSEALSWADYLALDLPLEMLPSLGTKLGVTSGNPLQFPAQVLISQVLPCGMGTCYACAIKKQGGMVLACTQGPVFDINQLEL